MGPQSVALNSWVVVEQVSLVLGELLGEELGSLGSQLKAWLLRGMIVRLEDVDGFCQRSCSR